MSETTGERPESVSSDVFSAADLRLLLVLARALYPHDRLTDGPYQRTIAAVVGEAERDPVLWHVLHDGMAGIRAVLPDVDGDRAGDEVRRLLSLDEHREFREALRSRVAWHLYDDRDVWAFIGYPGALPDDDGYLDRGFDDLTWLPEPRVEEYPLPLPEIGPLPEALEGSADRAAEAAQAGEGS